VTAPLRIATRKSQLALWQAEHVASLLRAAHPGLEIELVPLLTQGDRIQDRTLAAIGGKGLFIKELEVAIEELRADIAVHSMKDVPADLPNGLIIAAVLKRADPRDALVTTSGIARLEDLPRNAVVGASSLRRQAQIRALRADLRIESMRGNVDTRLRKLDEGQVEAAVLAAAGLDRLERTEWVRERFSEDVLCPAPGQGALAIECRAGDDSTCAVLATLDHVESRFAVTAERVALAALGGGCQVPIGAYCRRDGDAYRYRIRGCVSSPDGATVLRAEERGTDAQAMGAALADGLLRQGALQLLAQQGAGL